MNNWAEEECFLQLVRRVVIDIQIAELYCLVRYLCCLSGCEVDMLSQTEDTSSYEGATPAASRSINKGCCHDIKYLAYE